MTKFKYAWAPITDVTRIECKNCYVTSSFKRPYREENNKTKWLSGWKYPCQYETHLANNKSPWSIIVDTFRFEENEQTHWFTLKCYSRRYFYIDKNSPQEYLCHKSIYGQTGNKLKTIWELIFFISNLLLVLDSIWELCISLYICW